MLILYSVSCINTVNISLFLLWVFLRNLSLLPSPSSLQEKEVHIRQKMSKLRHRVEDKLEHWEEKSKDLIGGFLGMFGRDGRIVSDCVRGEEMW